MIAREIIERALEGLGPTLARSITAAIITALREAGYRVLEPGEMDELSERLTRPIIGIQNRAPEEAFDIMADRIRGAIRALKGTDHG